MMGVEVKDAVEQYGWTTVKYKKCWAMSAGGTCGSGNELYEYALRLSPAHRAERKPRHCSINVSMHNSLSILGYETDVMDLRILKHFNFLGQAVYNII